MNRMAVTHSFLHLPSWKANIFRKNEDPLSYLSISLQSFARLLVQKNFESSKRASLIMILIEFLGTVIALFYLLKLVILSFQFCVFNIYEG